MKFNNQREHTVGLEWELQLLDAANYDLKPGIVRLMDLYPDSNYVKPEFIQSCVEIISRPGNNAAEVRVHIESLLDTLQKNCAKLNMSLCGAGTHPFCKRLALITPMLRYQRFKMQEGYLGHTQQTFALHTHVAMRSGDEAMRVMSRMKPCLPALIAVSASSPFWRGYDTGHASYRHRILAATKSFGMPPYFSGWSDFQSFHDIACRSGTIGSFRDIHWDIRPHSDFGTLELRVMGAQPTVDYTMALCAFAHALMTYFANTRETSLDPRLPCRLPNWIESENYYRATHDGLDARVLADDHGTTRLLADMVDELIEIASSTADRLGETDELAYLRNVVRNAPAYELQRTAFADTGALEPVVAELTRMLSGEKPQLASQLA